MSATELKILADEFIRTLDDTEKVDRWETYRDLGSPFITQFLLFVATKNKEVLNNEKTDV